MSFDPHALKIYIDGSALPTNPGGAGLAAWIDYPSDWNREPEELMNEGFEISTNNRMELLACIRAYEWLHTKGTSQAVQRVQIVTDSKHVHDYLNSIPLWRKNGWRTKDGRPLENYQLWKQLLALRCKPAPFRIDVVRAPGKSSVLTKKVDKAAKRAASFGVRKDHGFISGKVGRTRNPSREAAKLFPAAGQTARIRPYWSGAYRRSKENRFKFQLYDESRSDYFEKYIAYATPEIGVELHRQQEFVVKFNENPRYPKIVEVLNTLGQEGHR